MLLNVRCWLCAIPDDDLETILVRGTAKPLIAMIAGPACRRCPHSAWAQALAGHASRILIIGLGGGSLDKFCYRRLPLATITALEVDPRIIALRKEFGVPSNEKRFRVVQGDGGENVARQGPRLDVILLDAYDRQGVAPGLDTPAFIAMRYIA